MSNISFRNVRKKSNFTQVNNELLWNPELTLQAKGLLSVFLSNSDEWQLNMKEIIKRSKNGRDAHYNIVNELIKNGYFARIEIRGTHGFESMEYIFSDDKKDIENELNEIEKHYKSFGKQVFIEYKERMDKAKKTNSQKLDEKQIQQIENSVDN